MSNDKELYCGIDISNLEFIGKGTQGSVYKLSENKVIKVFKKTIGCADQINTLLKAQDSRFFTKVYDYDEKSIIMEFLHGQTLHDYLKTNNITREISFELVKIMKSFKNLGFTRIDMRLKHIYLESNGSLKVIDPRKNYIKDIPYPISMLKGLRRSNNYDSFFEFIKDEYPEEYNFWQIQI